MVRQITCLSIWLIAAIGCWRLYQTLVGRFPDAPWVEFAIPFLLLAACGWVGFRLVNWPRFTDFLIAVEAEMNKVSWPTKAELIRASIVVIFTIFFLAIILFLFDIVWQAIFRSIGITT